jgi:hypothetical protein
MPLSRFFVATYNRDESAICFFVVLAPTQADAEQIVDSNGVYDCVRALSESDWHLITQTPIADYISAADRHWNRTWPRKK